MLPADSPRAESRVTDRGRADGEPVSRENGILLGCSSPVLQHLFFRIGETQPRREIPFVGRAAVVVGTILHD